MRLIGRWSFGVAVLGGVMGIVGCGGATTSPQPAAVVDTRAADETAIRAVDAAWTKAAESKDVAGTSGAYADSAVLMAPGSPITSGKEAIVKGFTGMMADKNFALKFAPTKVEVSKGGDMAYELGDYSLTLSDAKGKAQTSKAKYVVVWGKQADGSWKALVDAPTTTVQ
jgi:uncharacterized protein (TIGR02246 family)